jgi:TRAP-type C4-dicarboxylate transport system substrate-binding protein
MSKHVVGPLGDHAAPVRVMAVLGLLALLAAACGTDTEAAPDEDVADDETFELTWTTYLSADNPGSQATEEWMELVEERTGGRVTFEAFHLESLCSATEGLPCVADGRADMAYTSVNFHPSEFPLGNVVALPFVTNDMEAQMHAFSELYREHEGFRAEFDATGAYTLKFMGIGPSVMGSTEPYESIDHVSGNQVRAIAFAVDALDIIGANPVSIDSPEIYESMQRGGIEGWFAFPLEAAALDFGLQEVTDYITYPGLGVYVSVHTAINQGVWDSLPSDIQEIMDETSREIEDRFLADFQRPAEEAGCDALLDSGVTLSAWSEQERQLWEDEIGDQIFEMWIDESEELGAEDPAGFYEEYVEIIEEHSEGSDYVPPGEFCAERYEEQ